MAARGWRGGRSGGGGASLTRNENKRRPLPHPGTRRVAAGAVVAQVRRRRPSVWSLTGASPALSGALVPGTTPTHPPPGVGRGHSGGRRAAGGERGGWPRLGDAPTVRAALGLRWAGSGWRGVHLEFFWGRDRGSYVYTKVNLISRTKSLNPNTAIPNMSFGIRICSRS